MEYIGYVAILTILGFLGWMVWLGFSATEEVEEIRSKLLLTEAEVKKLTKPKLIELAGELGVDVDPKSTKAVIVAEIEKVRK